MTSQNVTVALVETATVPFAGVLLRTSGVSGPYDRIGVAVDSGCVSQLMVRATRKPASNRPGVHLLKRAVELRLIGKLSQEPPRSTR